MRGAVARLGDPARSPGDLVIRVVPARSPEAPAALAAQVPAARQPIQATQARAVPVVQVQAVRVQADWGRADPVRADLVQVDLVQLDRRRAVRVLAVPGVRGQVVPA